ncbi:hypothetical protein J1D01_16235 [Seonamhaeicola sp. NFXS20]|uniref:hypothetical protein n=1 Tax=Seonamhaeicola sp. NFXS20 TaxID=2816959 RepID=UPI003B8DA7C0
MTNFIEWENATVYDYEDESIVYVPLELGSKYSKVKLKATIKGNSFRAFYSFYDKKQSNNTTITTTVNYTIKGNLVSSFKSKESKSYIYTKVFRPKGTDTIKKQTKFALINKENEQKKYLKNNNFYAKYETIVFFEELDSDGDGFISYEESESYEGLKCHFFEYDTNSDGTLDELEYYFYSIEPLGCNEELDEVIINVPNGCQDDNYNGICDEDEEVGCADYNWNGICDEDETIDCIDENWNGICDDEEYGGGGSTEEDDQVINELTGKAKCVYDNLKETNNNLFKKTIGEFIDDPKYNLILQNGNCTTTNDACTDASDVNNIVITIEDVNQSALSIAALILHESIHAEIHRFVSRYESGVDPNNRPRLFQLYAYYKEWAENSQDADYNWKNDAHHAYMVENYVKPIASAIQKLDSNRYTLDYYMAYGWEGLRDAGYTAKRLTEAEDTQYYNLRSIVETNIQICN